MVSNSILQAAGFISADGKPTDGLVPVKGKIDIELAIDEQAIILEAKSFKYIDYVFFRRFSDARSSHVAAYVIDDAKGNLDENILSELHHQVWLQGTTPLLYIAGASKIDILVCSREPYFWNDNTQKAEYKPEKTFKKDLLVTAGCISEELKKFSALRLADGTFWDDPDNRKLANHDKAAHQALIQAVVDTDKEIEGENNSLLRRLLLLFVLIKYLEDRGVFEYENIFGKFHKGANCFLDVLQGNIPDEVNRLLLFFAKKFNGDVFDIKSFSQQRLTKKNLKDFATLIEKRTIEKQRYLWEQFSFKHLPVEIISHLYQRFVKGGHGTVYTPPFLASLLLDFSMPYNDITGKERILDPACGSGVFLVGAFKRLINLWRSKNNWKNPSVDKLKETLRKCIYGIDLDNDAVDLTAFSLSLAICDALRPNVIWNELKFDYLRGSNLFKTDFFDLLFDLRNGNKNILNEKFDIVIGNPPFESELSETAKEIEDNAQKNNHSRGKCPDNNIAYLFLEQASSVLKSIDGRLCIIQPAGILYNRKVESFRTEYLKKYYVDTIFDFVSIRKLYDAADPKTVAIFIRNRDVDSNHIINHWTFRRTVSAKEKLCFELDHYDHYRITQEQAENNPYVWRANLLGGGRLIDLSQNIQKMRTLENYLASKMEENWDYGEGFIAAKSGKRESAPFLTGKPFLPAKALTESGIDESLINTVKETLFRSAYTEKRYIGPIVLIKELESLPIAFREKGFLAYNKRIVGIHSPSSQISELYELYDFFHRNHDIYRFCCTIHGTQALSGKATAILKQDIDALPYPSDLNNLSFSFWEKTLCKDVLEYMTEYIRLGQNSKLLKNEADKKTLSQYSQIFIKMLGSIYENLKASNAIFLSGLICQPFYFGEKPELDWLDENAEEGLEKLVYSTDEYKYLRTIRIVRFYDKNVFLIIKPDRLRYWIRSTAIRDADETLQHLYDQGY